MPGLSEIFGDNGSGADASNAPATGISAPDPVDNDLDTDGDDNPAQNSADAGGTDNQDGGLTFNDPQPQVDPGFDV